jgi:hypothetical protein
MAFGVVVAYNHTYSCTCRFSKELSTRAPVTCTDARSLIILSRRLSHRSVIFFSAGCPLCGTAGQRHVAVADM